MCGEKVFEVSLWRDEALRDLYAGDEVVITRVGYRSHLNRYQYRYRYLEFGTGTQRYLFSVLYSLCNNKNMYFSEKISPKLSISTF